MASILMYVDNSIKVSLYIETDGNEDEKYSKLDFYEDESTYIDLIKEYAGDDIEKAVDLCIIVEGSDYINESDIRRKLQKQGVNLLDKSKTTWEKWRCESVLREKFKISYNYQDERRTEAAPGLVNPPKTENVESVEYKVKLSDLMRKIAKEEN